MRSQISVDQLGEIIEGSISEKDEYYLLDASSKIFLATSLDDVTRKAKNDFPNLASALANKTIGTSIERAWLDSTEILVTYVPLPSYRNMPNLNLGLAISIDTSVAFKPQRDLLFTLATGTGLTAVLVGFLAALLANRAVKPIQEATKVVAQIGRGDLETRLEVVSEDELGVLSSNINGMAEQLKYLSEIQQQEAGRLENARRESRAEADERAEQIKQEKELL